MNRTLLALWAIIFGSMLAMVALVIVWTGQREAQARLDLAQLLRAQLDVYNRNLSDVFEEYDRDLQQAVEGFDPKSSDAIVELERHPLCGLVVIVGDDGFKGQLWHPEPEHTNAVDNSLVFDAVTWIRDSNFSKRQQTNASYTQALQTPTQVAVPSGSVQPSIQTYEQTSEPANEAQQAAVPPAIARSKFSSPFVKSKEAPPTSNAMLSESHWTTWYHFRGLVLAYWTQSAHQTITMIILPRGKWLSDLVAALPDNRDAHADDLVQLVDVEGNIVSQWGNLQLATLNIIDAEIPANDPLEGWRLRLMLSPEARAKALGLNNRWLSALAAAGMSLALLMLGIVLTVSLNRQLQLARQQVSFVNQVSHELRTPLTNIRMYTDLAMQGLEAHRDLGVDPEIDRLAVIQQESTRLGRLIENVLAFARSGKPRPLRASRVEDFESLIDSVVATFEPQLVESHMRVERTRGSAVPLRIDREAVEQILVNLISNATKYAAAGGVLQIETQYTDDSVTVRVIDQGPGIPKRLRRRVFDPFTRVSNRLEDPAGTGIGLSIARQLARQHGGDCWLESTPRGCSFAFKIAQVPA